MKKSKVVLVIALAVVLIITCVSFPTFSWYSRSNQLSGEKLSWSTSKKSYDGAGVTFTTYYSADGLEYDELIDTSEANPYNKTVDYGSRAYFRTDISNSVAAEQNVSLYIATLTVLRNSQPSFCLGVNNPLRTYKKFEVDNATRQNAYTSSAKKQKYVYVAFKDGVTYYPTDVGIHYWGGGTEGNSRVDGDCVKLQGYNFYETYYNVYRASIPFNATHYNVGPWSDMSSKYNSDDIYYTDHNVVLLSPSGNSYSCNLGDTGQSQGHLAPGIDTFYSSAEVGSSSTGVMLSATGMGVKKYSSSNTSVATVDPDTGAITPVAPGQTTITVKFQGVYYAADGDKDYITDTCQLEIFDDTNKSFYDVPLATNLVVSAAQGGVPATVSVYWYIKNISETDGQSLNYMIDRLYLGL